MIEEKRVEDSRVETVHIIRTNIHSSRPAFRRDVNAVA